MTTENVVAVYKLQSLDVYFMQYLDPLLEKEIVVFYTLADCSPQATEWCQDQVRAKHPNPMSVDYFKQYYSSDRDELVDQEEQP